MVIIAIAIVVLLIIGIIILAFYIPSTTSTTSSGGLFGFGGSNADINPDARLPGTTARPGVFTASLPSSGAVVDQTQGIDITCAGLVKLWKYHVIYTHDFLDAAVNKKPNFDKIQTTLLDNQQQLGKYYGALCGEAKGKIIADLLTQHILEAKDIVVTDLAGKPIDDLVAQWYRQGDDVAAAIHGCVGKHTAHWYREQLKVHLETTLVEYKAIKEKNPRKIKPAYDNAINHMVMFAKDQC